LRVLLFHCTADRDPAVLLPFLKACGFHLAVFCPTRLHKQLDLSNDNTNLNQSDVEQMKKCEKNKEIWTELTSDNRVTTLDCIESAVKYIRQLADNNMECGDSKKSTVSVLVTGSLHLVGGVLYFEQPDCTN
jgi:23S rRNA pseudoU1915 N3-methylase RlmH